MKRILLIFLLVAINSCNKSADISDAYGNFEAVETIVSAEATGELTSFAVEEGQSLEAGKQVGQIDTVQLSLRKAQLEASLKAIASKTPNIASQLSYFEKQISVSQQQLDYLQKEKARTQNLIASNAAPTKQLDDINNQIEAAQKQIALIRQQREAQFSALSTQKSGITSEALPMQKQIEQTEDQIRKSTILNPSAGTVTVKLAEPHEIVSYGKPLYKIADLNTIILRAYVSGDQLVNVKVGQQVKVLVDAPDDTYKEYVGTVSWISSKAEFTPKVIQTKEERVNLVYAMKILVKNDGGLKIGMPGEVRFAVK
ncbi:HlyD family efflux transporter periplasmic adaptor subunit [Cytophagaceae bacterium DM2B3-1]|uniref:HlyD family efflux transporter periplasmic adaptor subunit n=1 Tax=Xanthocytophaga flava TaxID=3048013 RepID=A0ABT7CKK5_9BACT|nr:HlyD family efflux transporter periplasmic adaptor subunit [Xanthocytophaga flavus]MDJ1494061.1 HlyD family efflux transporter periplasmic adaptor subunit [Xanthocytophaga flavus]